MKEIITKEEISSLYRVYSDYGVKEKEYNRNMGILDSLWKEVSDKDEVTLSTAQYTLSTAQYMSTLDDKGPRPI
jgi:hypothetical protein